MSKERSDRKSAAEPAGKPSWDGADRRRQEDRRSRNRRLDERRAAGIGEIMDDRRQERGRRKTDRRTSATRRAEN